VDEEQGGVTPLPGDKTSVDEEGGGRMSYHLPGEETGANEGPPPW
jgi:hypothetical protein